MAIRLHVTAEGQTEQSFAMKVLSMHLIDFAVIVDSRAVLTSKDNRTNHSFRGGMTTYQKAKDDILTWMKEDDHAECRFTTMFDLYRLPDDFPGYEQSKSINDPYLRVMVIERELAKDIDDYRFIPYIQLHEFEALIFADPQKMDWEYMDHDVAIAHLKQVVEECYDGNPELINNGPETAPSKRILREIAEYDKVTSGVSIVEKIGVPTLCSKCTHFGEWIKHLSALK